jgi:creatinine amidohydrolase
MLISLIEWFKILDLSKYFAEGGDHAGEMETSVIIHYFPDLVSPLDEAGDGTAKQSKLQGVRNKTAWIPRQWNKVSEDTGVGNPKKASAEKGKKYLDDLTSTIGDFFVEMVECDLEDLYK